jgi:hypothetical protein
MSATWAVPTRRERLADFVRSASVRAANSASPAQAGPVRVEEFLSAARLYLEAHDVEARPLHLAFPVPTRRTLI